MALLIFENFVVYGNMWRIGVDVLKSLIKIIRVVLIAMK